MSLKLMTPPAPVVTLAEAKAHLRITGTDEDSYITNLVAAATGALDGKDGTLGRALGLQQYELRYDAFPTGAIELPLPPIVSVDSVNYVGSDGEEVALDADLYETDVSGDFGWVAAVGNWPSPLDTFNAVRIEFTAGYEVVPAPLRIAILLIVGFLYANREASLDEAMKSGAVAALKAPYKVRRV